MHVLEKRKKYAKKMLYVPLAATLTTRSLSLASKTTFIVPLTATAPSCLK
jgi:hypothetical protein